MDELIADLETAKLGIVLTFDGLIAKAKSYREKYPALCDKEIKATVEELLADVFSIAA